MLTKGSSSVHARVLGWEAIGRLDVGIAGVPGER